MNYVEMRQVIEREIEQEMEYYLLHSAVVVVVIVESIEK